MIDVRQENTNLFGIELRAVSFKWVSFVLQMTTSTQRAMLVDDVFALAHSGEVTYDIAMSFIFGIRENEEEFPVWMRASYALSSLLIQTNSLLLYGKLRVSFSHHLSFFLGVKFVQFGEILIQEWIIKDNNQPKLVGNLWQKK